MPEAGQARLQVYVLKIEKNGNKPTEYEDATSVRWGGSEIRLALADGASAAIYAGAWARMLVRRFVRRPFWTVAALRYRVRKLGGVWRHKHAQPGLPWYAIKKLESGAAATLIGVSIKLPVRPTEPGDWNALSIGDTCLFQMRGSAMLRMHPDLEPAAFGNRPALLYTITIRNQRVAQALALANGSWDRGDKFILASDALARWIRVRVDAGQDGWQVLLALAGKPDWEPAFRSWALQEQAGGRLKNDDLTMVLLET